VTCHNVKRSLIQNLKKRKHLWLYIDNLTNAQYSIREKKERFGMADRHPSLASRPNGQCRALHDHPRKQPIPTAKVSRPKRMIAPPVVRNM
jgi:hypothetical protein